MTQEEKDLLLKDLSGRLPYGVKYNYGGYDGCDYKLKTVSPSFFDSFPIEDCKPYLRPMSSMTEEEKKEYDQLRYDPWHSHYDENICNKVLDWLNARQLDYRGLIEKGLALEATEDMYKTE